jgi:hypothetical protein
MPLRQRKEIQEVLRTTRRLIPAGILLFWLIMMGLLVHREAIVPYRNSGQLVQHPQVVRDLWMGVYAGGDTRIGFINAHSVPGTRDGKPGASLNLSARLEMPLFGRPTSFQLTGRAWLTDAQGLSEFDFLFRSGEHNLQIEGTVADGKLKGRLHTAGETLPVDLPVGKSLLLSSGGVGMSAFDMPFLEPGKEIYVDAFDPTTMSVGKAKIACIGKETIQVAGQPVETNVIATTIGGMTTRAWVSADAEILRAETPFGFALKKIAPEEALAPIAPNETANLVRTLAIKPKGKTPHDGAVMMHIRMSGIEKRFEPPSDAIQTRTPDGYVITQPEAPRPEANTPLPPKERAQALASDAFVSADHEKIKACAAKIVGEERDPWKRAVLIEDWVFNNLKKTAVLSVPTALDVLRTREGDCNEHAVLYAALARAAGVPTRIAIGLVWSDDLQAFGYHAWNEVYTGQWTPIDPTFGQPLADATHLKLLNGGIDQWARLVAYIGKLQIDVLEVR